METKCEFCGNIVHDMQFKLEDCLLCSKKCYSEMKFILSHIGMAYAYLVGFSYFFFLVFWFIFLTIPLTLPLMYGIEINGSSTTHIITASLFLSSILFTIKIDSYDFIIPSRYSVIKIFTQNTIPFWIVFFYYLYVITNLVIILCYSLDLNRSFSEEYFNSTIANTLLFLSCFSIMILLRNKYYLNE